MSAVDIVQQQSSSNRLQYRCSSNHSGGGFAPKVVTAPAVHGMSYTKPNAHLNQEALVFAFAPELMSTAIRVRA
ncbi:hypothetical protein [Bradyrhizobium sp. RDM4]|uniref:hypothetical protein n=1 Tax=Bradyrhizobium sp. RDM4 TaxID=3378765 RepID=UPI0038FD3036